MFRRFVSSMAAIAMMLCLSCSARPPAVVLNDLRAADRVVVETTCGPVAGFVDRGVTTFLGVPYAQPPVGDLRFAPPREPEKWTHLFPAVAYGPVANQSPEKTETASRFFQSEDCLSINVWTRAADHKQRPVIVFMHGGGFIWGGTADPLYNGEEFARRGDVVFVSANYRLGAFGFLYLDHLGGGLRGTGNHGLLDQIAALQWVKANISRFGGDPANVTIMGESAGSISVSILMASPLGKGLFHKAIAQSGAPNITRSRADAAKFTGEFMEIAGVTDVNGLRKLSADRMIDAQVKFLAKYGLEGDAMFSPVVDGVVITQDPYQAIAEGSAAGIPLLNGTTQDDFRYWIQYMPMIRFVTPGILMDMAPNYSRRLGTGKDKLINYYKTAYPSETGGDLSMRIATDMVFWFPHVMLSEAQSKNASTYMYVFAWPSPADGGMYGAMHAIELPFVFFQLKANPFAVGANPPIEFAKQMNDTWIHFARNGVPEAPGLPEWPAYSTENRAVMILDVNSKVVYDPKRAERELFNGVMSLSP